MNALDYDKALLKTRIDAHRAVMGLEFQAVRMSFDPLRSSLSLLGFDRDLADILAPLLRSLGSSITGIVKAEGARAEAKL